nr:Fe-S oxidoreductase [Sphingobium sp. EM0848]
MKSILFAGAAMLAFGSGVTGFAVAQDMPASAQQPAANASPPPVQATSPVGADPNAGQPTGAVPPDTGMAPAPAGVPRDPTAPVGSSANPATVGGNMTPPPIEAKNYPLCSKTVQDSCINPSEAPRAMKKTARRHH